MVAFINYLGEFFSFNKKTLSWCFKKPLRAKLFMEQFHNCGVDSLPIIFLVSLFTGMVFALQTTYAFRIFNAETMVGSTVGLTLARELAPVFTALMVTARVGSQMAAELGSMKVSEQVDALEAMAIFPHQFLVVPRVVACTIMVPLLTVVFNFIGVVGSYLIGVVLMGIPKGPFVFRLEQFVDPNDVLGGILKAVFFGFLLSSVACFEGMRTKQGARGVGLSTTRAVVIASVSVLIVDYFLTQLILEIF